MSDTWSVMHGERCIAQLNRNGLAKVLISDFMPYDLWLEEADDIDPIGEIIRIDAHGYYMMNIIDYLVGNTDKQQ